MLVAPLNLRMERDVTTRPLDTPEATFREARVLEYQTLAGVLLFIGFILWIRYCLRCEPLAALCLAAFIVAYLPISNLLPLNATIAEHWLYVPGAFLLLAVALTLQQVFRRRAVILVVGGWALFLGARTFLRQADWRDQRTFIESTIAAGGSSARMWMNLGNVEFAAGHQDAALADYREALRRTPDQPVIWLGYASILLHGRDFQGAREALGHAETSPLLAADCLTLRATLESAESGRDPGDSLRQAVAKAPGTGASANATSSISTSARGRRRRCESCTVSSRGILSARNPGVCSPASSKNNIDPLWPPRPGARRCGAMGVTKFTRRMATARGCAPAERLMRRRKDF
ncbi:MAG: tetratricopeptide repeat protein [Chthoniobacter sp.]